MGFESPLLPKAAIEQWARANVGGWWRLQKVGDSFYEHQLWELRRGPVGSGRHHRGKTVSGRYAVLWKVITTMRLQRVKVRAPPAG